MVAGGTAMLPGHHPSRRDQREGRDDLRLDGIVSHYELRSVPRGQRGDAPRGLM